MAKLKDSRWFFITRWRMYFINACSVQRVIMLISITIILFNFETNISYVFLLLRNFKISPLSVYCLLCFVLQRKTEKKSLITINLNKFCLHAVAGFGLCIKVGRGQGDGDIGTRVWGLGTWGRETRDLRTSSMGRGGVWDGDRGRQKLGCRGRGMWMIIAKVGDKCDISFFAKMCYLCSTLDSIFQNHIKHLLMFTQNTSFY